MKDLLDIIEKGSIALCPDCGNYDGDGYEYIDMPDSYSQNDLSEDYRLGLSLCGICGRYFK